jgi:hypothetical protein
MLRFKSISIMTALAVVALLTVKTVNANAQTILPKVATVFFDHDGDGIPNGLDPDFIRGTGMGQGDQANFIDENGDGICDLFQNGGQGMGRGAGNRGQSGLRNFVDADGDGVCDNFTGTGTRGAGRGSRVNFIDADGDGVCDNAGIGVGSQMGKRGGRRGGRK